MTPRPSGAERALALAFAGAAVWLHDAQNGHEARHDAESSRDLCHAEGRVDGIAESVFAVCGEDRADGVIAAGERLARLRAARGGVE